MNDSTPSAVATPVSSSVRRRAVVAGIAVGGLLVALLLGYRVYDAVMTPHTPDPRAATLDEVVSFVIDDRGLLRLPRFEQDRFMKTWKERYNQDAEQRALKSYLDQAPASSRQAIQQVLFRVGKRKFLDDAQEYVRIRDDSNKAYAFVFERMKESLAETAWLKGHGDPARDLTSALGSGMPRNPEEWIALIVRETTPQERVIGEQYINAIKNVREQEKKMSRPPPASR